LLEHPAQEEQPVATVAMGVPAVIDETPVGALTGIHYEGRGIDAGLRMLVFIDASDVMLPGFGLADENAGSPGTKRSDDLESVAVSTCPGCQIEALSIFRVDKFDVVLFLARPPPRRIPSVSMAFACARQGKYVARLAFQDRSFGRRSICRPARKIEQARGVGAGLVVVKLEAGRERLNALLPSGIRLALVRIGPPQPWMPQRDDNSELRAGLVFEDREFFVSSTRCAPAATRGK
jgi:hypothetical protein